MMMNKNYDNIPAEIRAKPNWVGFRVTPKTDGSGWNKMPVNVKTGKAASSKDASTWTDFATAVNAVKNKRYGIKDIGYAFDGDGIVGIDVDHCVSADGELNAMAKDVLGAVSSYTEYSVSGGGLHIIARCGWAFESGKRGDFEIYRTGRFFVFTGNILAGRPTEILDCTEEIKPVYAKYMTHKSNGQSGDLQRAATAPTATGQDRSIPPAALNGTPSGVIQADGQTLEAKVTPPRASVLSDTEILDKARAASNGAKFSALWSGDFSGYGSHSEADLAFCGYLIFWSGDDAGQADRLFRQSGLYRPKWDERHGGETYGEKTLRQVLSRPHDVYKTQTKSEAGKQRSKRAPLGEPTIAEIENAYHLVQTDGKSKRLTNFVIKPERKLVTDDETIYSVTLIGTDGRRAEKRFNTADLVSAQSLKRKLSERDIGWSFLASDRELELIKEHINGLPCQNVIGFKGVGMLRLPTADNPLRYVYVGDSATVDGDGFKAVGAESVVCENPIHSDIEACDEISNYELIQAGHALLEYNELPKTAAVFCFLAMATAKPKLTERGVKFPHLVIVGEAGSGKSHTVEKVVQTFFSIKSVLGASKITNYTFLTSAGASNNIPLIIDEYKPSKMRESMVDAIHNGLRDLYDGHEGQRGKADMSVKSYRLTAPLVLSGEESPSEPALKERSIELLYSKTDIDNRQDAGALVESPNMQECIRQLGKAVLLTALRVSSSDLRREYDNARNEVDKRLAPRARNNIAAVSVGAYLLELTAARYGADFKTAYGIERSELLPAITEAVKRYTLGGGDYNKSVVDQAFDVFDRMTEVLKEGVHYKRVELTKAPKTVALAFDIRRVYDLFTRYSRECNHKGEILSLSMFLQQLTKKDYFLRRNYSVQLRDDDGYGGGKFHSVKCYVLDAKRLAACTDVSNILERCGIVFPDTPVFEQVAMDDDLPFADGA
jgi:primase-polymerase (primpol)-like protein